MSGSDTRHLLGMKQFSRFFKSFFWSGLQLIDGRFAQTRFRLNLFVKNATAVGHPGVVDGIVADRRDPINLSFPTADHRIDAHTALRANAAGFLQKPNPHFEAEIGARKRADWADVDRVERIIVIELLSRITA